MRPGHFRTSHLQLGLTLLEVLIALLILSIGLVGAAVLMVQSLQNTHSSLHTSLASAAALDFEERLWLDLGRTNGCPAVDTDDFNSAWTATPGRFGLPLFSDARFGVTPVMTREENAPPAPDLLRIRLDLAWREDRFGAETESFTYQAGVLCRPLL